MEYNEIIFTETQAIATIHSRNDLKDDPIVGKASLGLFEEFAREVDLWDVQVTEDEFKRGTPTEKEIEKEMQKFFKNYFDNL